jgi:hypothetical protein
MSNVIRFLEAAGRKPLSAAEYDAAVSLMDVDSAQREALNRRDQFALADAMGGREGMRCLIFSGEELQ